MARDARTLEELGELALIERIARRAGRTPGRDWIVGIGDDAAVLRPRRNEDLVLSTDARFENVHFRFANESPRGVGRRALVASLSDLASMGARPIGCLLALAVPASLPVALLDGLVRGVLDEARRYAAPLVGGNLARAEACSLTITVVGAVARGRALRRGRVRVGDRLLVTGQLGRSALARARAERTRASVRFVPEPRIAAGRSLAALPETSGCVDLSDGLATDLGHLLAGTGLGAEIEAARLPRPRGFARSCGRLGLDPDEMLVAGGEDYELLFALRDVGAKAADGRLSAARLARRLGVAVHEIGRVRREPGIEGLPALAHAHHF